MTTSSMLITPELPNWIVAVCNKAGTNGLQLAEIFLYVGLGFGIATAVAEAVVALRGVAVRSPAAERAALTGLQAVIAALTGLLQALKDAKAWLALIAVGLVLLFIAASTPDLCVPEEYRPKIQQKQQQQERGGTSGTGVGRTGGQGSGQSERTSGG